MLPSVFSLQRKILKPLYRNPALCKLSRKDFPKSKVLVQESHLLSGSAASVMSFSQQRPWKPVHPISVGIGWLHESLLIFSKDIPRLLVYGFLTDSIIRPLTASLRKLLVNDRVFAN